MNNLEPVTKRDHLEPVNSRKDYLSPRAKIKPPRCSIGDVVRVRAYEQHSERLGEAHFSEEREFEVINIYSEDETAKRYYEANNDNFFTDKDILMNLTTNKKYE